MIQIKPGDLVRRYPDSRTYVVVKVQCGAMGGGTWYILENGVYVRGHTLEVVNEAR